MTTAARLGIALLGVALVVAWALFEMEPTWLAFGGGLIVGNLAAWLVGRAQVGSLDRRLTTLAWVFLAALVICAAVFRNAFLAFLGLGAFVAAELHFILFHHQRIRRTDRGREAS